jgi:hypothetical protein
LFEASLGVVLCGCECGVVLCGCECLEGPSRDKPITTPWSTGLLGVAVDLLPGQLPPALVVQADLVRANPVSLEEMARVDRESYS